MILWAQNAEHSSWELVLLALQLLPPSLPLHPLMMPSLIRSGPLLEIKGNLAIRKFSSSWPFQTLETPKGQNIGTKKREKAPAPTHHPNHRPGKSYSPPMVLGARGRPKARCQKAIPFIQHCEVNSKNGHVERQGQHYKAQDASSQVFSHGHLQQRPGQGEGIWDPIILYTFYGIT